MEWYPIRLSTPVRRYAFGARLIPELLGKLGEVEGVVAESWEVSDHPGTDAKVVNGALSGTPFRRLVGAHPSEVVGEDWSGPHFPLLLKFLDASHRLPVHLHADEAAALEIHGEPNGKTEAWHIVWAEPEAYALVGVRPGLSDGQLTTAFKAGAFEDVMFRVPVAPGDTVYVPAGTLHTFGPGTLVFEVQQTSDLSQSVMPTDVYGAQLPEDVWDENIRRTLVELRREFHPVPFAGLTVEEPSMSRTFACAGPHFALERWRFAGEVKAAVGPRRFLTLTNLGDPVEVGSAGGSETLARGESCVLPAAISQATLAPHGVGDVLACYVPDLEVDVLEPLLRAGHALADIRRLGDVGR